jgi:formylglycine-generating enzyme required for sulfatase activity
MLSLLHSKLIAKLCVIAALPLAAAVYPARDESPRPDDFTVTVPAGAVSYRVAGEFTRDGVPVNAPLMKKRHESGLVVMKVQVTAADYARCVQDSGCRALDRAFDPRRDRPVVGVSWEDATAYARWFSRRSGQVWRLPTDEEWAFFAADRFHDDAVRSVNDGDFSARWIAKFNQESASERAFDRTVRATGSFGPNALGLLDLAGNVWEWTDTCFVRQKIDASDAAIDRPVENCGVRVVEGQHRTYVTNFIRDARAGGCAVGVPPANLGFRLVRDDGPRTKWIAFAGWRNRT